MFAFVPLSTPSLIGKQRSTNVNVSSLRSASRFAAKPLPSSSRARYHRPAQMTSSSPGGGGDGQGDMEETVSLKDLKARLKQAQQQDEQQQEQQSSDPSTQEGGLPTDPEDDERTEREKEIARLRAAEKFIEVDEGKYECTACGYVYEPQKGEPRNGIAPGTTFAELPDSYTCASCRSPKRRFESRKKIIAGFADNQTYGFGSNTMTGGEKSLLIFGGLAVCALLLLSGYALN